MKQTLRLTRKRVFTNGLTGRRVTRADVQVLLTGDADVYLPNGQPLCLLRRRAIPAEVCETAHPALSSLKSQKSDNRGNYTGEERVSGPNGGHSRVTAVSSAVVGYFDRQGDRLPFCRTTAFTANQVEAWRTITPMVDVVAGLFRRELPQRYMKQKQVCDACDPAWIIAGTPYSTLTVNNNVVAACHQDKGDYKEGFGVISVVRRGHYEGAWLMFPEWGVGADLHDGDVLFFNPHEWHANTPFENQAEDAERISVVYYLRERMQACGTPEQELENAKRVGDITARKPREPA